MKNIAIMAGGGVKGYITTHALEMMENKVGPLHKHYDLMAGSSVGAINAAFLASGILSAKEINDIYPEMVKKIFAKKWYPRIPKYDRRNFIELWNDYIGLNFKMKDCKTKLQITSVDMTTGKNHFFKSWEDKDGEERLLIVVLRSFAAPLYFGPLVDYNTKNVWMDGGMGTSNIPIDQARIEARDILDFEGDLQFDAFGCGYVNEKIPFKKAKKYKVVRQLARFMQPIDGGLARSQSRGEQVRRMKIIAEHENNIGFRCWDIEIPKKIDGLDKVKYLSEYKKYGIKMSKKPIDDIPIR